jgi:hypothetical protein
LLWLGDRLEAAPLLGKKNGDSGFIPRALRTSAVWMRLRDVDIIQSEAEDVGL